MQTIFPLFDLVSFCSLSILSTTNKNELTRTKEKIKLKIQFMQTTFPLFALVCFCSLSILLTTNYNEQTRTEEYKSTFCKLTNTTNHFRCLLLLVFVRCLPHLSF